MLTACDLLQKCARGREKSLPVRPAADLSVTMSAALPGISGPAKKGQSPRSQGLYARLMESHDRIHNRRI